MTIVCRGLETETILSTYVGACHGAYVFALYLIGLAITRSYLMRRKAKCQRRRYDIVSTIESNLELRPRSCHEQTLSNAVSIAFASHSFPC